MADRLELEARFKDLASAGVRKLGKTLEGVRPSNGMQAAQKWMGEFRSAADKADRAVRPMTTSLTALGVGGLAASMSMSELVKQIKGLSDGALNMRELSRQSRISMGDLQRLQYVATKFHMDPGSVDGVLAGWSDKMLDFRKHTGDFYNELMRQNQDVAAKIMADSPVEALKDTLEFLSRIKDPALQRRWADSMNLGGLVPMLGKGPQGLAEAFAEAGREVKPITQALVEAADKLNASTARMTQSWTNLKNDIGPSVIDPLSHVIDRLDETLKFAAAHPGDAVAMAGVGGLTAAALYARRRIMAGSKIAGGPGAAGELAGAAREQTKASGSLLEAAVALKEAAAELRGRGAGGAGSNSSGEGGKPGGTSPDFTSLVSRGLTYGALAIDTLTNAPGLDEQGDKRRQANSDALDAVGDGIKKAMGLDWLQGKVDEWRGGGSAGAASLYRGYDLKKDIQEGSKAGIVAGLRELAQQQELGGDGTGGFPGVKTSTGGVGGSGRHFNGGRPFAGASLGDHARGGIGRNAAQMAAGARESFNFWLSKGLTREQASGLVGMEQGESQFNPRIVGDGGLAHGAFQHHPERRARILAATGINIDSATHAQQLEAAYWEFQHTHKAAWDAVKQGRTATDAARSGVYLFEAPKDKRGQSIVRGGMAEGWLKRFNDEDAKRGGNPSGAGTPAPSAPAQGAADAFAARRKALQGAAPGHRAGGWIRGPGTGTSDSIPAWLSHGEFVVRAGAAQRWGALLHAINGGLPGFADGGEVAAGLARHRSWRSFFRRPLSQGGMGAPDHVALGAMAMMMGESGRWMSPSVYNPNDVDGPSGGSAQWHDVVRGRYAGRIRRFSDLMAFAMGQHADWKDVPVQQAWFKREAMGPMAYAWNAMRRARTAAGALSAGVHRYEVPAHADLEVLRRMPNITRLAREAGGGGTVQHEIDPIQVDIRHHPHTGLPTVRASAGRGVRLGIKTSPTMRST